MQNGQKFSDGANRFRSAFSAVSQASPQKQGQGGHTTPLHEAARKYEVDKIASLLRQGCDPNALDGSRCQPLHILLYDGAWKKMLEILVIFIFLLGTDKL